MGLKWYIARRIPQSMVLVFVAIILNFAIMHSAPGSPLDYLTGAGEVISPEYAARLKAEFGLDKPLHEQLIVYLGKILREDFGYSFKYRQPVLDIILARVPATILLTGSSILFAIIIGIFLGVSASKKPYSALDNFASTITLIGYSTPTFWLGMILILVLSVQMRLFPTLGMTTAGAELTGWAAVTDVVTHLALPTMTLGTAYLAIYTRLTRASMLEELRKDYILTAWSKGLDERTVYYVHAFRNAMLPVVTVLGLNLGLMLTGATLTETVFAWPGLGRLVYDSLLARDYPVLMGVFMIISISVILANLLVDILYAFLDPRIRYE